jgi:parallel beta-helix repeat protein
MKKQGKNLLKILGALLLVLGVIILSLGFFAVPQDEAFAPEDYGAGSSAVQPSYTGLARAFPDLNGDTTPAAAELGRMLFFDPVLSENNDLSCAHCHHPDLGFADGQRIAVGAGGQGAGTERAGGVTLIRSTPSLWNVGFPQLLFWDGRETSLEQQALTPLTRADEMGVTNTADMAAEIAAFPEYAALFGAAFGDGAVTEARVLTALAAFQRTLISQNSPFDQYAAGDFNALTAAQRRGLALFRSAATRCFECHQNPTFGSDTLRIVGVPSMLDDPGAGSHDFRVPSLRNAALTAPYMHNGAFDTLEQVVRFYADGGGNKHGFQNIDPFVAGFDLTEQETADLVAFLYALTDESGLPAIPAVVPSGLPVVAHLENPAREQVNLINAGSIGGQEAPRSPMTIRVETGETIQAAVDRAIPGDTVEIPYGVYHEIVVVDINDLTLIGIPNENGEYPVLDGQGMMPEGVISSGNNFEVAYLRTINYTHSGVLVEGVTGIHMHHMIAEHTGVYGLYPVQSTDVLIEDSVVSGVNDAGIYAGQSANVIIRNNEVYGNVLGIEAENTVNVEIYGNHAHDNTMGVLVVLLPNLTSKVNLNTKVYNNLIENNNHANFAEAGTAAAIAPAGSGIAIIGADSAEVYNNVIRGNKTAGVGVFDLAIAFERERINVPTRPEGNWIHDNTFENNGYEADPFVADLGIPGADILWDVSGAGNRFDERDASTFPAPLPTSRWAVFFYNIYWQLLNFVMGLL